MNLKSILIVSALSIVGAANAGVLASWTFEASAPTTSGPFSPEVGSGSATGFHSGTTTYSSPSGNGSARSFSSNNWLAGDYYQFSTSTLGQSGISISFDQISSNTGPANFGLSYSTDGQNFTQFGTYTVLANAAPNSWSATTPVTTTSYSFDLSSVSALGNKANAYFRLIDLNTTAANGSTVASGGTNRIDNVTISSQPVPEPATMAALGLGALGLLRRRRSAK